MRIRLSGVYNRTMETQTKTSGGARDFFINLGAIIALGVIVGNLIHEFIDVIT